MLCTTISLLFISSPLCAQQVAPEQIVLDSKNWSDLYNAYKRIGKNADGVVAGAFTDKVSQLLADDWERLSELRSITRNDRTFLRFVTLNLNEAVPSNRAIKIRENAISKCPPEQKKDICDKLLKALDRPSKGSDGRTQGVRSSKVASIRGVIRDRPRSILGELQPGECSPTRSDYFRASVQGIPLNGTRGLSRIFAFTEKPPRSNPSQSIRLGIIQRMVAAQA